MQITPCSSFWPMERCRNRKLSLAAKQIFHGPSWGGSGFKRTSLQLLIMSKHMLHYLVEKSKVFPACVVITISWPQLRAKIFISSGCDFYELTASLRKWEIVAWTGSQNSLSPAPVCHCLEAWILPLVPTPLFIHLQNWDNIILQPLLSSLPQLFQ